MTKLEILKKVEKLLSEALPIIRYESNMALQSETIIDQNTYNRIAERISKEGKEDYQTLNELRDLINDYGIEHETHESHE